MLRARGDPRNRLVIGGRPCGACRTLAGGLREMLASRNRSGDETLVYDGEYLEALITRA